MSHEPFALAEAAIGDAVTGGARGGRNAYESWREIRRHGFIGQTVNVRRYVCQWPPTSGRPDLSKPRCRSAVEATLKSLRSNGPTDRRINRVQALQREMCGGAALTCWG